MDVCCKVKDRIDLGQLDDPLAGKCQACREAVYTVNIKLYFQLAVLPACAIVLGQA
jgi:hypothetical protein